MSFQLELRRHIALRECSAADAFWREQIAYLGTVIGARQSEHGRPNAAQADELVAGVLCEFVTRAWRTFRGQTEAQLRGFLRGILLHHEANAARKERIDGDLVHYAGLEQDASTESLDAPMQGEKGPVPRELSPDDLRFLARLSANNLVQQDVAQEMGTSSSTVSRRLLR
ncbi:MAG: DNA-directed RNA polymerase specialized sigma24 family protein, partial [Planctomycetota bacterium]